MVDFLYLNRTSPVSMPVPARKKSNASGRRRRSHDALKQATTSTCPQCSAPIQPHHACRACGFYRGRSAVDMTKGSAKLVKKAAPKAPKAPKAKKAPKKSKEA